MTFAEHDRNSPSKDDGYSRVRHFNQETTLRTNTFFDEPEHSFHSLLKKIVLPETKNREGHYERNMTGDIDNVMKKNKVKQCFV